MPSMPPRICTLCSPRSGPPSDTVTGVFEIVNGVCCMGFSPITGCTSGSNVLRCLGWGSCSTRSSVLGPVSVIPAATWDISRGTPCSEGRKEDGRTARVRHVAPLRRSARRPSDSRAKRRGSSLVRTDVRLDALRRRSVRWRATCDRSLCPRYSSPLRLPRPAQSFFLHTRTLLTRKHMVSPDTLARSSGT